MVADNRVVTDTFGCNLVQLQGITVLLFFTAFPSSKK